MDEKEARRRLRADFGVSRETFERIDTFLRLLAAENGRQNLVSRGTLAEAWNRHVLDSAQLTRYAPGPDASWLDLGTGAGFPGVIVALLHNGPITLVEERRRRVEFLEQAIRLVGIGERVHLQGAKLERFESRPFDVISARAFAPLDRLLALSHSFSTAKTRWILPKGRNAASELEAAKASWHGDFRLEPSLTDDDAWIIVAEGVQPKAGTPAARRKGAR